MLASTMQTLVFYPFLLIVVVAGAWLAVSALRKSSRKRTADKAERLARDQRFDELARLLTDRGTPEAAARILLEHKQFERAIDLFVGAGLYVDAAKAAVAAGDNRRGAELFQRAGDHSSAGACYLAIGEFDDAVRLLRKAGELATAARYLERRGEIDKALALFLEMGRFDHVATLTMEHYKDRQRVREVADRLVDAEQLQLAAPLYVRGQFFLEAGKTFEKLGRVEQAIQAYLQQNYFEEAASLYARTGKHRKAAEFFIKGGLVSKAVDEMLLAGEFLSVARLFRRSGQPARALDVIKSIALDSSDYRDGQLLACSIEVENHRFEDAAARLDDLLRTIGYSTENLEVVYRLVDLQLQLGKREEAMAALEQAKRAGITDPGLDEQLMGLRESAEGLFEPDVEDSLTIPAHRRARLKGDTTTIGFPRSDRYVLKRKLARGGHGILFLVEDRQLQRDVVLKLLHSESLPSDLARKYFLREARTAAGLNHPNIVRVFDYGEIEKRPYLAMEYVDGLNLIELQESLQNEIPRERKFSICIQLCDALAYAHTKTIIHRDVKMENVMVTTHWQTKLMDFGLAKALNENPDRSLFIIGTPFYMSPEQIVGDSLDHRTDIYSLGVLMYRLFTDRLPFEEGEVLSHHRFTPPPDPRDYAPEMPRLLAETILVCLKKDREERFDSATLIAQRLKQLHPAAPG
jgi:tetratricopeptide (TPR) repeat protein